MANRPAPALVLRPGDREELERWVRASRVPASAAKRARIVLLAADGVANTRIAELVGATVTTVLGWRERYQAKGVAGLADAPRPGRPRTLDHRAIVAETLKPPPKKLGVTHWSSRLLAQRLKISNTSVARAWRAYGVRPWKAESFRFSTDPELVGKVTDICGLYLAPPENAIVLCVDEKSQIQALDRTVPILPMQEGRIERRSHDYYRHGTSTLFAALDIASRKHEHVPCRLIVRRVKRLQPLACDGSEQGELFATYRHHAFITNTTLGIVEADQRHRDHAVVEQVSSPSSRTVHWHTCHPAPTPRTRRGSRARRSRSTLPAPAPSPPTSRPHGGPACAARSSTSRLGSPPPADVWFCTCPPTGHGPRTGPSCTPPRPAHRSPS